VLTAITVLVAIFVLFTVLPMALIFTILPMYPALASLSMFPTHLATFLFISPDLGRFHRWSWSG
jgi:hypothetical protein